MTSRIIVSRCTFPIHQPQGVSAMKKATDNLSRCASELLVSAKDLQSFYNDPISIECGFECADIAVCSWDDRTSDILTRYGYTSGDKFMDDFRERTNDKCAFTFSFLVFKLRISHK